MYTMQGKIRPIRHTFSTLSPRMLYDHTYLTRSTYSNLSYSHQQIWIDPLHSRRRAPDSIHSRTDIRSVGPYPASLPQQPKSSGEKSSSCWQPTTRLTGLISLASDRYIQYLLSGANRTVLNWHRHGLQSWRCCLATYPLPDLPDQLSPLSPSGPARSLFNPVQQLNQSFEF
jgi:hypothetical protein